MCSWACACALMPPAYTRFCICVVCTETHTDLRLHFGGRFLPGGAMYAFLSRLKRHRQQLSKQTSHILLRLKLKPAQTHDVQNQVCVCTCSRERGPWGFSSCIFPQRRMSFSLSFPQPLCPYPHHPLLGASDLPPHQKCRGCETDCPIA